MTSFGCLFETLRRFGRKLPQVAVRRRTPCADVVLLWSGAGLMGKQRPAAAGVYLRSTQSKERVTSDYSAYVRLVLNEASRDDKMLRPRPLASSRQGSTGYLKARGRVEFDLLMRRASRAKWLSFGRSDTLPVLQLSYLILFDHMTLPDTPLSP